MALERSQKLHVLVEAESAWCALGEGTVALALLLPPAHQHCWVALAPQSVLVSHQQVRKFWLLTSPVPEAE